MNKSSLCFLLLACSLIPSTAAAQMGIAKGRVVDQDGKPVADATIVFEYLGEMTRKFKTKTNDRGRYVQVVNSGRYRIVASAEGYRSTFTEARIRLGPAREIVDLEILNLAVAQQRALEPILEKFKKASALSNAGKLDEALAVYEELRAEDDAIHEVHFNMGTLHARKQDWPAAEACFKRVLELKPEQVSAALALASIFETQGRPEEAETLLEGLADEHPDNAEVLYELAVAFDRAQRVDEAQAALEKVIELDPTKADAEYALARIALNKGGSDEAVGHLERYLELAPADARYRELAEKILAQLRPAPQ